MSSLFVRQHDELVRTGHRWPGAARPYVSTLVLEFTLRLTGRSPAWATFFTCGLRFAHLTRPGVPTPSAGSRRARPEQLPVSAADPSGSASQRHRALGGASATPGPSRQRYGARPAYPFKAASNAGTAATPSAQPKPSRRDGQYSADVRTLSGWVGLGAFKGPGEDER